MLDNKPMGQKNQKAKENCVYPPFFGLKMYSRVSNSRRGTLINFLTFFRPPMLLFDTLRLLDFGILITVLHKSLKIG